MKKSILIFSFGVAGIMLTGCGSSSTDSGKTEAEAAEEDVDQAKADYLAEYQKFKSETSIQIATNERMIAELKLRASVMDEKMKIEYEKTIVVLEQRNDELRNRADNYNETGKMKWISFKKEFNHDMNELGSAFKDLIEDNEK